jgi:hypothetical protein
MVFVFDAGFSPKLVAGLNLLEQGNADSQFGMCELHFVEELGNNLAIPYEEGSTAYTDDQVIEIAGRVNGIVFTQDKDFRDIKRKAPLYIQHNVGAVFFPQGKTYFRGYWPIIAYLTQNWEMLKETIFNDDPPFCYSLNKVGKPSKLEF